MKAIVAALPRELNALVRGWPRAEPAPNVFVWRGPHGLAACAGMGPARATLAVRAALAAGGTQLISAGLAGACDSALRAGQVVMAGTVIDSSTGERFGTGGPVLVTTREIASIAEKSRLHASYGAAAVDMEAATIARLAQAAGVPFRAIKAISDESDFELEALSRFATKDGQFREAAFALHAALRPSLWSKLIALGRNSGTALKALARALRSELE